MKERSSFQKTITHYLQLGNPIVYIDESGFAHDMPRRHGYSLKGKRCYGLCNWGAKGRSNVIGALMGKKLLTASLFDCNINTDIFTAWFKQSLLPQLIEKSVLVLDNATFHRSTHLKVIAQKAGHFLLYLPTYSPDLNPIEHVWAQAKSIRRKFNCSIEALFKSHLL